MCYVLQYRLDIRLRGPIPPTPSSPSPGASIQVQVESGLGKVRFAVSGESHLGIHEFRKSRRRPLSHRWHADEDVPIFERRRSGP